LVIGAGAGFLAWDHWFRGNAGYPLAVIKQANDLQERLLSFDSHITVPLDFGTPAMRPTTTAAASSTWPRRVAGDCPGRR